MELQYICLTVLFVLSSLLYLESTVIPINFNHQTGRKFDGIGGLSGGGATSKLLINYEESYRSQILDFLFTPNFGASLHILKVEIGGDAQSTEGTEASHMHNPWEENYNRGYEWWLMKEAKKRNPGIILYALPWAFPGWVGRGTRDPYVYPDLTADYVVRWILGAKRVHNLTIDYVGIWNEKPYTVEYILLLRKKLNTAGLKHVQIIASDGGWEIANDILKNESLSDAVYGIGAHYPGTVSSNQAQKSGKPLWSSEDYSTLNNDVGAGCWARILNQNYVNGLMTSTISWNLIASYYDALPYTRCSLMTANQPWSGHYELSGPLWVTAHTTQFADVGWEYLQHGHGVGKLPKGGSYVTLLSPDRKHMTVVIETMSHDHSICIRPALPPYTVQPQNVTLSFKGIVKPLSQLHTWKSQLRFGGNENSTYFAYAGTTKVANDGTVLLSLLPDELVTLTTISTGKHGTYPVSPPEKPFPLPYKENFDGYPISSEPYYITPQVGSFEVVRVGKTQALVQTVLEQPVDWCSSTPKNKKPNAVLGNYAWSNTTIQMDVMLPSVNGTAGLFIASRVDTGGCQSFMSKGVFLWLLFDEQGFRVTGDLMRVIHIGKKDYPLKRNTWYKVALTVKGQTGTASIDGQAVTSFQLPKGPSHGFAAMGTDDFGRAYFDNVSVTAT